MIARGRKRLLVAGAVPLALAALIVIGDGVTSSPVACGTCHEIAPHVESWRQSPHVQVDCVDCHIGVFEWYELPKALVARTALFVRDTARHWAGEHTDPVDADPDDTEPMADSICLACHVPGRQVTPGQRILIDHDEHAARNGSCVSCHLRTAHPLPERGDELSFMGQCFTCHAQGPQAAAPGGCAVCHPADMDLLPASHESATWVPGHGDSALHDRGFCAMCHDDQYCTDCHGVVMPHPAGWAGAPDGHAASAERDRAICARCHEGGVDMCTVCHHVDYNASLGSWLEQHPTRTSELGSKRCMACHSPLDCSECHAENAR